MQRQGLIGLVAILFLLLFWLGWTPATPAGRKPRVDGEVSAAPAGPSGDQRALLLLTATPLLPEGPRVRLDVHVEANAQGEGSAHVVASSQGGQALAHIDTKGQASGQALADAPALPGCTVCGDAGPLDSGQGAEDRGQKAAGSGQKADAVVTPGSGQAVILADANLRSAPALDGAVMGGAHAGDRYVLLGHSADQAWMRVCCTAENRPAWIYGALVQAVDLALPGLPLGVVVPTPAPSRTVTLLLATPTPALAFALVEQEQHSEANYATIYAWVQDGHGVSLAGYRLAVSKDGVPLAIGAVRSTAYRQGTTRPSAAGGPEDKPYNLKVAFNPQVVGAGFTPAGAWAVQLLDPENQPVAPLALFVLRANDDHMEMYLNYGQR